MRALAQRNSLLSKVRAGAASQDSIGVWTREVALHGFELMQARAEAVSLLAGRFSEQAAALGLAGPAGIAYRPRSDASGPEELGRELEDRLPGDLDRGFTTHGPHRDDLMLTASGRDLRRYGSQGQQRLGLLALLLAEWEVLRDERGSPPVLLLDDVLSELDRERRGRLLGLAASCGQTLISTADASAADGAGARVSFVSVDRDAGVRMDEAA
jgi:DNA replication and repair protein RecF